MRVGIVGCGISGAYLAWKLAKENDVTVFERKSVIGKEVCSGLVSKRIWDFVPRNNDLVENTIKEINIHFRKKGVILRLKPEMIALDHKLLDQYVAKLARENGAKILTRNAITAVREDSDVNLKTNKGSFEFDRVIGCDGVLSKVGEAINTRQPKAVLGIQMFENKENYDSVVDVWPTKNGLVWKIPRGKTVEYGIIEEMGTARHMFKDFCKTNRIDDRKIQSAIIPAEPVSLIAESKIALCGDAAGFTKPWSRGGIVWSLTGANMLVREFPDFYKYNKVAKAYFNRKILISSIITKLGIFLANKTHLIPRKYVIDSDWVF
jgi:flavin-dependent dehydrogenase